MPKVQVNQDKPSPSWKIDSSFDGDTVKHIFTNKNNNPVVAKSNQSLFASNLVCETGHANIDNACVCPSSSNTVPFYNEKTKLDNLFQPGYGQPNIQVPKPIQCLMTERGPSSTWGGFDNMHKK